MEWRCKVLICGVCSMNGRSALVKYRVSQKDLNNKNAFLWGIPHYHWSNMAYNTLLDGAPRHYHRNVRNFLNETFLHWWIKRAVNNDQHLLQYSGHQGHRTWRPLIFSCVDTLKTMPTIHHSPKMCVNCKIAFELHCKPLMGTCWSVSGKS